jgi:hypothetical protein
LVIPFAIVLLLYTADSNCGACGAVLQLDEDCLLPRCCLPRNAGVHAVAKKRTAIHDQPFRMYCQWVLSGFHRFFMVFFGFYRNGNQKMAILGDFWGCDGGLCAGLSERLEPQRAQSSQREFWWGRLLDAFVDECYEGGGEAEACGDFF